MAMIIAIGVLEEVIDKYWQNDRLTRLIRLHNFVVSLNFAPPLSANFV